MFIVRSSIAFRRLSRLRRGLPALLTSCVKSSGDLGEKLAKLRLVDVEIAEAGLDRDAADPLGLLGLGGLQLIMQALDLLADL
ncbi:hypothetical protein ASD12_23535 [Mesorhizobium sp. Root102]|nr:hypothetical protein ASD12_23535 [Mesorhizobium sp. Root102]